MRPLCTANDDQPGPTGLRQISTGGDLDQSVRTVTPVTMLSRLGPRKPGHSGVTVERAAGLGSAAGAVCLDGAGSRRGAEGAGIGLASSCCSVVADQRQANVNL